MFFTTASGRRTRALLLVSVFRCFLKEQALSLNHRLTFCLATFINTKPTQIYSYVKNNKVNRKNITSEHEPAIIFVDEFTLIITIVLLYKVFRCGTGEGQTLIVISCGSFFTALAVIFVLTWIRVRITRLRSTLECRVKNYIRIKWITWPFKQGQ